MNSIEWDSKCRRRVGMATVLRLLPNRINYSISLCMEDKCPYTLLCDWQFIMFFNRYQLLLLLDSLTLWPCSSTSSLRRIALQQQQRTIGWNHFEQVFLWCNSTFILLYIECDAIDYPVIWLVLQKWLVYWSFLCQFLSQHQLILNARFSENHIFGFDGRTFFC